MLIKLCAHCLVVWSPTLHIYGLLQSGKKHFLKWVAVDVLVVSRDFISPHRSAYVLLLAKRLDLSVHSFALWLETLETSIYLVLIVKIYLFWRHYCTARARTISTFVLDGNVNCFYNEEQISEVDTLLCYRTLLSMYRTLLLKLALGGSRYTFFSSL